MRTWARGVLLLCLLLAVANAVALKSGHDAKGNLRQTTESVTGAAKDSIDDLAGRAEAAGPSMHSMAGQGAATAKDSAYKARAAAGGEAEAAQERAQGLWQRLKDAVLGTKEEAAGMAGRTADNVRDATHAAGATAGDAALAAGAQGSSLWARLKLALTGASSQASGAARETADYTSAKAAQARDAARGAAKEGYDASVEMGAAARRKASEAADTPREGAKHATKAASGTAQAVGEGAADAAAKAQEVRGKLASDVYEGARSAGDTIADYAGWFGKATAGHVGSLQGGLDEYYQNMKESVRQLSSGKGSSLTSDSYSQSLQKARDAARTQLQDSQKYVEEQWKTAKEWYNGGSAQAQKAGKTAWEKAIEEHKALNTKFSGYQKQIEDTYEEALASGAKYYNDLKKGVHHTADHTSEL